ncbi:hypothetical protein ZHAS_00004488 [Anopheles sinensis]|uniref:Uncharacterized protein n=1 Tax=Anopheles sinensis TaxID=74873 RepID=A0A084VH24_ANOSI|nr:hypothetical protein ZHAS_00004488 [Anopheles sinensis]
MTDDTKRDVPDPMDCLDFLLNDRNRLCEWPIAGPRGPPPVALGVTDPILSSYYYEDSLQDLIQLPDPELENQADYDCQMDRLATSSQPEYIPFMDLDSIELSPSFDWPATLFPADVEDNESNLFNILSDVPAHPAVNSPDPSSSPEWYRLITPSAVPSHTNISSDDYDSEFAVQPVLASPETSFSSVCSATKSPAGVEVNESNSPNNLSDVAAHLVGSSSETSSSSDWYPMPVVAILTNTESGSDDSDILQPILDASAPPPPFNTSLTSPSNEPAYTERNSPQELNSPETSSSSDWLPVSTYPSNFETSSDDSDTLQPVLDAPVPSPSSDRTPTPTSDEPGYTEGDTSNDTFIVIIVNINIRF